MVTEPTPFGLNDLKLSVETLKHLGELINETNWGNLDYLIIDTPPGTGDIHLTLMQQYEIAGVIVVTTPQHVATSDVGKAIAMFFGQIANRCRKIY